MLQKGAGYQVHMLSDMWLLIPEAYTNRIMFALCIQCKYKSIIFYIIVATCIACQKQWNWAKESRSG